MTRQIFFYSYIFVYLSVTYFTINQCHALPTIPYPKPPQIERISSVINQGKNIVNRLRCLKGWKRFGSSCYYSSIIRSTPHTANETCHHLPVNHSHLMHIRHPIELSYAAHLFLTNNLTTLLVQTDPQLFKDKPYLNVISATDRANWRANEKKLHQARLEFEQDGNRNNTIYASDDDEKDDFQWFDRIRNLCQGLAWNVMKNDSRLFSFTTYKMSNTVTCALSDADLNSTYEYTCQYVLDFCFGSLICKHGECVSGLTSFKCLCPLLFEGDRCDKLSQRILEAVFAFLFCAAVILGWLIKKICHEINKCCCTNKQITKTPQLNRATAIDGQPNEEMRNGNPSDPRTTGHHQQNGNIANVNNRSLWEKLKKQEKVVRLFLVSMISLILFCSLLIIPAFNQYRSFPLHDIDPTNSQSMIDKASSLLQTCKPKSFYSLEDWIFPGISLALTVFFHLLEILCKHDSKHKPSLPQPSDRANNVRSRPNLEQRDPNNNDNDENTSLLPPLTTSEGNQGTNNERVTSGPTLQQQGGHQNQNAVVETSLETSESDRFHRIATDANPSYDDQIRTDTQLLTNPTERPPVYHEVPQGITRPFVPIDPHKKTDRIETAAILAILTFEILKVFNDLLLAVSASPEDGVWTQLGKQIVVVFVIGFRYYPMLISLHFKDQVIQSLALHIIRFLTFVYVLGIVGYTIYRESICFDFIPQSENFTIRDEVLLRIKLGSRFIVFGLLVNTPHFLFLSYIGGEFFVRLIFGQSRKDKKDDQRDSSPLSIQESRPSDRNRADNRSWFKQFCDYIYKPHKRFHFGVLSISMYTINFIILWHLTSTFIFLYTTRTMSPISFLTNTLQQTLNIKMKDTLFHPEIIISAIGTALIYTLQLFRGIANLRQHIEYYSGDQQWLLVAFRDVIIEEARAKATKYPGYLIRFTVGGYVITFHLLLFVVIIPRLIWYHSYVLRYIPNFLVFMVLLYVLQYVIVQIISKLMRNRNRGQLQGNNNGQQSSPQSTSADGATRASTPVRRSEGEVANNEQEPISSNTSADRTNNTQTVVRQSDSTHCCACCPRFGVRWKSIVQYFMLVANCFIGVTASIWRLLLIFLINIVSINRVESSSFADPFKELDSPNTAYWHFVYEETCIRRPEEGGTSADSSSPSRSPVPELDQNRGEAARQVSQEVSDGSQQAASNRNVLNSPTPDGSSV